MFTVLKSKDNGFLLSLAKPASPLLALGIFLSPCRTRGFYIASQNQLAPGSATIGVFSDRLQLMPES